MTVLLLAAAHADVARMPEPGERFLTHQATVEGLAAHPGWVVVAYDPVGATVETVVAWKQDGEVHTLADGRRTRGPTLSAPTFRLLSTAAYEAWSAEATAVAEQQRAACAATGAGCGHISRFVPKLPTPAGAIDCGRAVTLVTSGPEGGPDTVVDVLALAEAGPERCVLREVRREQRLGGAVVPPARTGNCDTAAGGASVALGLAILLLAPRRTTLSPSRESA